MQMQEFVRSFALPLLAGRKQARVCEIGACRGDTTDTLGALPNVMVTVIDPCLDCNLDQKYAGNKHVTVRKGTSLAMLPELRDAFDCILIDGDHNWYTVYHELKAIFEKDLLKQGGVIFFHDIEWPWGRRDMYYQPEMIPPEYRHNWERRGVVQGKSELTELGGFLPELSKATHEGGPRNGVLTAIEDFLRERGKEYDFFRVRVGAGLGILYRHGARRDDLAFVALQCKGTACNLVAGAKQFTKIHLPTVSSVALSLLRKRTS